MKLRYKTKPRKHQVKAVKKLLANGGGGIQAPMRSGKSWIAINFCGAKYYTDEVRRVLVVTVTSGLGVWEDEIAKHCPVPWRVMDWNGELLSQDEHVIDFRSGQVPEMNGHFLDFLVVNYQNSYGRLMMADRTWAPMPHEVLKRFRPQVVISDEVHHLGNPQSVQSKYINLLAADAIARVGLTGTRFHRKPFYVFGQQKFIDRGKALGSSWDAFKKRIAVFGGFGDYKVLRYRNLGWMTKQVSKDWFIMRKPPPLHEPVINEITFHLKGKDLDAYSTMLKDRVLEIGDESVMSDIILSLNLRLSQIAGGWVKLPSGKYHQVGNSKAEICKDRLNEYMEQGIHKAVVGCRFIPELKTVALIAKSLGFKPILFHGGVPAGRERTKRIKLFKDYDGPVLFISQLATGSQAIDLSAADAMMFYSLSESYLIHDQFMARIAKYDEQRTLMYDVLLALGTIDIVTWMALKLKKDVADFILENPALVERLTAVVEVGADVDETSLAKL